MLSASVLSCPGTSLEPNCASVGVVGSLAAPRLTVLSPPVLPQRRHLPEGAARGGEAAEEGGEAQGDPQGPAHLALAVGAVSTGLHLHGASCGARAGSCARRAAPTRGAVPPLPAGGPGSPQCCCL